MVGLSVLQCQSATTNEWGRWGKDEKFYQFYKWFTGSSSGKGKTEDGRQEQD